MRTPRSTQQILDDSRVAELYHDDDGWWCWLKPDYWSTNMECGTLHEMTIGEIIEQFEYVEFNPNRCPAHGSDLVDGVCPDCTKESRDWTD